MHIHDIERETGLDRATIRFYEKEGIVIPNRTENGYRIYSDADLQLILKVKLLRQLGVSLFKIKALQRGSEDLSQVILDQIKALEEKIQLDMQAKFVCEQMRIDGVQYATLNAPYYLDMFQNSIITGRANFQEQVQKETHPWRRYFARMLDYTLLAALLDFILVVIFRIRPYTEGASTLVGIAAYFVAIPVFAAMLHFWGTTPAKWAMGIKIENINGGKLSYYDAFKRECDIIWSGLGFFIPILSWWRLYVSYKEDSAGEENYWNHTSEIIYVDWTATKKFCLAGLYCVSLLVGIIASLDAVMPKYITNKLTVKQFAECHFDYEREFQTRTELVLNDEGKWEEDIEPYVRYSTLDSLGETVRPDFQYKLMDGYVRGVHYNNTWESEYIYSAIPEYCKAAMYTLIGSRPGATYFDLAEMEDCIAGIFCNQLAIAASEGECTGSFSVNDVCVSWEIVLSNCEWIHEETLLAPDGQTLRYTLDLNMEIVN